MHKINPWFLLVSKFKLEDTLKLLCANVKGDKSVRELTLDFCNVERFFGVPVLLTGAFFDSVSRDGKSGVPGGVRSLKEKEKTPFVS